MRRRNGWVWALYGWVAVSLIYYRSLPQDDWPAIAWYAIPIAVAWQAVKFDDR